MGRARWRRVATPFAWLAAVVVVLGGLRWWPHEPLILAAPRSQAFYARGGELLRLSLAADDQFRLWVPLDQIAPALIDAVLLYEDRAFYWHPGVNPLALVRSAWATWVGGDRQGGSTVTMQLARRLYRIDSRQWRGKVKQIAAACWLELRYGKRELLEAYLNLAPYGGNIEGVGTASLVYFHKRAAELTVPEALALAVIPQNPRKRLAGARTHVGAPAALVEARDRLWAIWQAHRGIDEAARADMRLPLRVYSLAQLPFMAPHATEMLRTRELPGEIRTGLDVAMQATLERTIAQAVERGQSVGIDNAAAMLVDATTMEVRALVGSADWSNARIDGQVNGTRAKRSPGSTLKPFIYALALDQGVLHPRTVLKDAPTAFGPFSPENFDGRFVGPITAQEALVRSRNVPAVVVANQLRSPSLYAFMQQVGIARLASEAHYGLALSLGGGEVTMEELARLYALLANDGRLRELRWRLDEPAPAGTPVLSAEAAFITLDMLSHAPRPDTAAPARPAIAWKTGTSWGFRDAWTAGVFGRYVLVVWVGNFDGKANPAFIGVQAAAPVFMSIVDALRSQHLEGVGGARPPPARVVKVEVCAASGEMPNAWCPQREPTWFIPGVSPIRVSTLHRPVYTDLRTGQVVCQPGPDTRVAVYEYWPSQLMKLFNEAGMPRRQPPPTPCTPSEGNEGGPQIVSPLRALTYTARLSRPSPLTLRANAPAGTDVFWFADDAFVGRAVAEDGVAWVPPHAGRFVLRAVNAQGQGDSRDLNVEFEP